MNSPFPGMDPYLERFWGDIHQAFITYVRDLLQSRLPTELRARMQERVYAELPEGRREYYPDVRVVERPRRSFESKASVALLEPAVEIEDASIAEPLLLHLDTEPVTESYIEIIDVKSGNRVVSAIEVLSPSNKRAGDGQRLYLQQREDMKAGGVNFVEIDLLRDGDRDTMIFPFRVPPAHRSTYQARVWRAAQPTTLAVYGTTLRERLPVIPIPLRPTDREVPLDLQKVLDQCYRNGGYDDVDYRAEPDPPLAGDDQTWADGMLREQGRR